MDAKTDKIWMDGNLVMKRMSISLPTLSITAGGFSKGFAAINVTIVHPQFSD